LLLLVQRCCLAHAAQAAHFFQPLLLVLAVPPQHRSHHCLCQQLLQATHAVSRPAVILVLLVCNLLQLLLKGKQQLWVCEKL
jgi:hypothetical protein